MYLFFKQGHVVPLGTTGAKMLLPFVSNSEVEEKIRYVTLPLQLQEIKERHQARGDRRCPRR